MSDKKELLANLQKAVIEPNLEMLNNNIDWALRQGMPNPEIRQALFQGIEHLRQGLVTNEVPLPMFLVSLDTLYEGLEKISSLNRQETSSENSIVIGTIEGDPHDLGKNIISRVYQASGYKVYDLGRDVTAQTFIDSVRDKKPSLLALSAMMSTTMAAMPEIIRQVKEQFPHTVIMLGGAPLDAQLARSFGADGYAESVVTVLEETEAAMERVSAGQTW
jgi:methanogenic corrinoid protein MtbC1